MYYEKKTISTQLYLHALFFFLKIEITSYLLSNALITSSFKIDFFDIIWHEIFRCLRINVYKTIYIFEISVKRAFDWYRSHASPRIPELYRVVVNTLATLTDCQWLRWHRRKSRCAVWSLLTWLLYARIIFSRSIMDKSTSVRFISSSKFLTRAQKIISLSKAKNATYL